MLQIILSLIFFLGTPPAAQESIHQFTYRSSEGKTIPFSSYKGKKILIVNTASECGYTPQYEGLEKLYKEFGKSLVVIAFPANNFGGQEPGSDADIREFCSNRYSISFPMAAKISVKGADIDPLFAWLIKQENPDFTGSIQWNFEKFLLDENGKLIHRYRSGVKPDDQNLKKAILDQKPQK